MNHEEAKKAFAEYDTDNDGFITLPEYIMTCRANSCLVKDDDLVKMFRIFDENKDNKISLDEYCNSVHFLNITKNFSVVDCLELRDAFESFDLDKDGKITLSGCFIEYINGCKTNGNRANNSDLEKAFRLFDYNNDGFIDKQEFEWAVSFLASTSYDRDPDLNSNIHFNNEYVNK